MIVQLGPFRPRAVVAGILALVSIAALAGCDAAGPPVRQAAEGAAPQSEAARDAGTGPQAFAVPPEETAWQWFLTLNEPLTGGKPKAWESWKQTSAVYLPDGSKPLPWDQNPPLPEPVVEEAKKQGLDLTRPFHNLDTDVQVDGLTLRDVYRQDVRYQLLMNRGTFDYILATGVYNVNGQEQRAADGEPLDFPAESFELKTSWIWIGDDQAIRGQLAPKYYIVNAYYRDGDRYQVGQAALTGMHIISKVRPNWVWTTFENVNNPEFTVDNAQPPGPQRYELPIAPDVEAANAEHREALRQQGSIFAEYRLNGVQSEFVDPEGQPILLASSQIESAFQHSSSCITCHGTASYSVERGYFDFVDRSDGGITYYTGNLPEAKLEGFTSLDFVWSLKRASRQR